MKILFSKIDKKGQLEILVKTDSGFLKQKYHLVNNELQLLTYYNLVEVERDLDETGTATVKYELGDTPFIKYNPDSNSSNVNYTLQYFNEKGYDLCFVKQPCFEYKNNVYHLERKKLKTTLENFLEENLENKSKKIFIGINSDSIFINKDNQIQYCIV